MHVLNVKVSYTSHFDRTHIHLIQAIMTKWGTNTILLAFFPQSGEYNSFIALKNDRTVSINVRVLQKAKSINKGLLHMN